LKANKKKMKAMKTSIFKIIPILTILIAGTFQSKADFVKKEHRSWPQNTIQSLSVDNKFGNINFINTREDSVTIDATVTFLNTSENKAAKLAALIHFKFSMEDGKINAKTIFDDEFKTNNKFEIVYTINIPTNRYIDVKNKFGNVTLGDLKSGGEFDIAYGNIYGKSICSKPSEKVKIDLKYGDGSFESIDHLDAKISYSKLATDNVVEAELNTRFSTIDIDNCKNVVSDSQYDSYTLGSIGSLTINSKFTNWEIDELKSKFDFVSEYGNVDIKHVNKDFKLIRIDNQFGDIKISIDPSATYNLKGDSKFCDIKYPKTNPTKLIKDNFHTYVEATIGTGSLKSTVEVQSKYGKVDLME